MIGMSQVLNITGTMLLCAPLFTAVCIDPLWIIIKSLGIPLKSVETALLLLRYPLNVYIGLLNTITLRIIATLGTQQAVCRNIILRMIRKQEIGDSLIDLYKESKIVAQILYRFEGQASAVMFGGGYFIMLMSAGASYVGYIKRDVTFALPAMIVVVLVLCFLEIAFLCGGSINKISHEILRNWKNDVSVRKISKGKKNGNYYKRLVRSLQATEIPVGSFCMISRGMEMMYYNLLLNQLVNVLMGMKAASNIL